MGSDSEDENPQEARRRRKKEKAERVSEEKGKAPQKAQGYNYWAIGILALFALPLLLTGILKISDMMYPEEAKRRDIRQRTLAYVNRCYEVANPSKLSEVEHLVDKYYNREDKLVNQLRAKYAKYPECH